MTYSTENPPSASEYLETVFAEIRNRNLELKVIVEPGRSVVANAGILVTRVLFLKVKNNNALLEKYFGNQKAKKVPAARFNCRRNYDSWPSG